MIPASEMKQLSEQNNPFEKEISELMEKIQSAAKKGYLALQVNQLSYGLDSKLKDQGYKIERFSDQRDGSSSITIYWS